jgi:hypothetical protein
MDELTERSHERRGEDVQSREDDEHDASDDEHGFDGS